jgi:hypothetical protein
MGVSFDDKTKSHFFLSALQHKCIEVDRVMDRLDKIPDDDPLPEELTLTDLVLHIKYIQFFQNYSTAVINHYVCPNNDKKASNSRHNRQSSSSDSRLHRMSSSDARPFRDFNTGSDTQCICGRWGHSVENYQQTAMHFLLAKYFQKYVNMTSAAHITKRWSLTNEKYSQSARSTVHVIRSILSEDMAGRTDDEIIEKLYTEDDALSDFL